MATRERQLYTANDLWELQSRPENQNKNFEIIDGELHEVTPNSLVSNLIAAEVIRLLGNFVREHDLGYIAGTDAGFILSPGNVVEPDVAYIAKSRIKKMPERYFEGAPDLAVEVVSPTDSIKATQRKAKRYLQAGTRIVWIFYPADKTVDACTLTSEGDMVIHEIPADGELNGGEVVPGFKVTLRDVFKVVE